MPVSTYLDHNASTPVYPEVLEAMAPYWHTHYANPSSSHHAGRLAATALHQARAQWQEALRAPEHTLIFTASATEANNLMLRGTRTRRWILSAVEHDASFHTAQALARQGTPFTLWPVDAQGRVDWDQAPQVQPGDWISVIAAHNEWGTLNDLPALSAWAHAQGACLHTDATQALGKIPVDLQAWGVDAASFSAHKAGGPRGVGVLALLNPDALQPLITGGPQEHGLRAGTEALPQIVGSACAAGLAVAQQPALAQRWTAWQQRLEDLWVGTYGATLLGQDAPRLPNTTMALLPNTDGEMLRMLCDRQGLAMASGSACHSHQPGDSRTLRALGLSASDIQSVVRLSMGHTTCDRDIEHVIATLAKVWPHLHHERSTHHAS